MYLSFPHQRHVYTVLAIEPIPGEQMVLNLGWVIGADVSHLWRKTFLSEI